MRVKKLLTMLLATTMVAGATLTSYAAGFVDPSQDISWKGKSGFREMLLPWDVNPDDVKEVGFRTEGGVAPSYEKHWDGLKVKNLYHNEENGTEIITVTMRDGTVFERTIKFGANTEPAPTDQVIPATNLYKDTATGMVSFDINNGEKVTYTDMYLGDVHLDSDDWVQSDKTIRVSAEAFRGMAPGTVRMALYNTYGAGVDNASSVKIVQDNTNAYAWASPDVVTMSRDNPQKVYINASAGKGTKVASGIKSMALGDVTLAADDYGFREGSIIMNTAALTKLGDGFNNLTVTWEDGNDTISRICVYVHPRGKDVAQKTMPSFTPSQVTYMTQSGEPVAYQYSAGEYTVTNFKVDDTQITNKDYTIIGTQFKFQQTFLDTLEIGTHNVVAVTSDKEEFALGKIVVTSNPSLRVTPTIENKTVTHDLTNPSRVAFVVNKDEMTNVVKVNVPYLVTANEVVISQDYLSGLKDGEYPIIIEFDDPKSTIIVCTVIVKNYEASQVTPNNFQAIYDAGAKDILYIQTNVTLTESLIKETNFPYTLNGNKMYILPEWLESLQNGTFDVFVTFTDGTTFNGKITVKNSAGTDDGSFKATITPTQVTFDKRSGGDLKFEVNKPTIGYVLSDGTSNTSVATTETIIPEAALIDLPNGTYKVVFKCANGTESYEATINVTRSGAETTTNDNTNWSYPGKTLPNRTNALGGGKTSGGSSGSSSSSSKGSSSGTSSSSSSSSSASSGTWQKSSDGRWMYKKANGSYAQNEWVEVSGTWYHIGADRYMNTGWFQDGDGHWYLLDEVNGNMKTGWQVVYGQYYYLATSTTSNHPCGSMYHGEQTPDGYYVDANGVWAQ